MIRESAEQIECQRPPGQGAPTTPIDGGMLRERATPPAQRAPGDVPWFVGPPVSVAVFGLAAISTTVAALGRGLDSVLCGRVLTLFFVAAVSVLIGSCGPRHSSRDAQTDQSIIEVMPENPEVAQARKDVLQLADVVEGFARVTDRYPESLVELVNPDKDGLTYLAATKIPLDPWDRPYRYEFHRDSQKGPRVFSLGADGAVGGQGVNQDIDSRGIKEGEK